MSIVKTRRCLAIGVASVVLAACLNPAGREPEAPPPEDTEEEVASFITTWQTDAAGDDTVSGSAQITLPLAPGGTYDFTVDWGDESSDVITSADQILPGEIVPVTHTYASAGTYDVTITGTIDGFGFGYDTGSDSTDADKLTDVKEWGPVVFRNDGGVFMDADSLVSFSATDAPDLSAVTSMYAMFQYAGSFNGDLAGWDTSSVSDMRAVFANTNAFNGAISNWNTSSVTDMSFMFRQATAFNVDIGSWDVSSVTTMEEMFRFAIAFNQNIGGWEPFALENMKGMFRNADAFNQNIGGWNTAGVTDMSETFFGAASFNHDLTSWDTSQVTTMRYMFSGTESFNGDISGWQTPEVKTMQFMFLNAKAFNRSIAGWNTSQVNNMSSMFSGAEAFNQDLSGWCVTQITSEPLGFDTDATSWTLPGSRPDWGSCP